MITQAIIAEYNPFHNGHLYQLKKAKEITGADYTIAVMSGSFLQRGQAAMWNKFSRAEMALGSGIDAIFELPFAFATGSALDFSRGAISILNKLNCVDYLCFGAETDDLELFYTASEILLREPLEFTQHLRSALSTGASYPAARQAALCKLLGGELPEAFFSSPNNILALEYITALKHFKSDIKPVLIKREVSQYHDENLNGHISSATAIRKELLEQGIELLKNEVPAESYDVILNTYKKAAPLNADSLTPYLQHALLNINTSPDICDLSEDLYSKIKKININTDYDRLVTLLCSKNYTASRIKRGLLHLILQYTNADRDLFASNGYSQYASLLGFRKAASPLLREIKNNAVIPLITKKADFNKTIIGFDDIKADAAKRCFELDIKASNLYNCMLYNEFSYTMPSDYEYIFPII